MNFYTFFSAKIISIFLICVIAVPFLGVPNIAYAVIVACTNCKQEASGLPLDIKNTLESSLTTVESTISAVGITKQNIKSYILDPAAKLILRTVMRVMKQMVLNYIVTGEFGGPRFITNFQMDARMIAENAARSFLSQVTGINFCGFFPSPIPLIIPINFTFQFQCTISSNLYSQFLKDPLTLTEVERYLVMQDPSTNFIQSVVSAGQFKAEQIAQALVARSAETLTGSGFLGDAVTTISHQDQADYAEKKSAAGDGAFQKTYGEAIVAGKSIEEATAAGNQARAAAGAAVQKPQGTRTINTPGQAVKSLLDSTILGDALGPVIADEFDQAVVEIVNTAASVLINKGLSKAFAP